MLLSEKRVAKKVKRVFGIQALVRQYLRVKDVHAYCKTIVDIGNGDPYFEVLGYHMSGRKVS